MHRSQHTTWVVWTLGLLARMLLSQAAIIPHFYEIHPADEVGYIYGGRMFMNGLSEGRLNLVAFQLGPAVSIMHALLYAPVHSSLYWIPLVSWASRLFLFTLLWFIPYLISKGMRHAVNPLYILGLLFVSPVIPRLLENSSDALFAAMSGLALWQLLVYIRSKRDRHLIGASAFIGLAALSRNDGLVVFALFLALLLLFLVRQSRFSRAPIQRLTGRLILAALPFLLLVGGYLVVYGLLTGTWTMGTGVRAYFAFEQAEGAAYSADAEALVEGVFDARRLYGTPEENEFSVLRAIARNPTAFLRRLLHLPRTVGATLVHFYGNSMAVVTFGLTAAGAISWLRDRISSEQLILLTWPAHLLVYLVFFARGGYLLTPYFALFTVAAAGLQDTVEDPVGGRVLRVATTVVVVNAALGLALRDSAMLVGSLAIAGCALLIWWRRGAVRLFPTKSIPRIRATLPALSVLFVFFALANPLPEIRPPILGSTAEEQAGVYLAEHYPRSAQIAAHMPAVVWSAKMNWRPMVWDVCSGTGPQQGRFQQMAMETSEQLRVWISRTGVQAIYLDGLLKHFQPELYELIEENVGPVFVEVFSVRDTSLARKHYYSSLGIQVDGWHRILEVRPNLLEQTPPPGADSCS